MEPERRLPWYGLDALCWASDGQHFDIVELILTVGAQRLPERIADGVYAEWFEVWDRAQPEELQEFREWICRRFALCDAPELVALRTEMVFKVRRLQDERGRKIAEEIGLSYEGKEEEEEVEEEEKVEDKEEGQEVEDEEDKDKNQGEDKG